MLSSFRDRFGTAGLVVAIIALVVALAGGAVAANNSSSGGGGKATASAAKGKPGPRGPRGKTGPAGPQGSAGANGKDGANGSNGSNGAEGAKGATGPTGNKGSNGLGGPAGDAGPTGPTGPTGTYGGITLPTGVTETGFWSFSTPGEKTIKDGDGNMVTIGSSETRATISFPDRLEDANLYFALVETDPTFANVCGAGGAGGTPGNPKAPPGYLCVWKIGAATGLENATFEAVCPNGNCPEGTRLINRTGAFLKFKTVAEGPAFGVGSWALTGI